MFVKRAMQASRSASFRFRDCDKEMTGTIQFDDELFDGGPPLRVQRFLGLIKPGLPRVARRAELAVLIGWTPLVALVAVEEVLHGSGAAKSFFTDFAVHARSLIVVPLLILAESDCTPRLGRVVRHFLDAGLITESECPGFNRAVTSTRRLLNSTTAEITIGLLAYGLAAALILNIWPYEIPAWYRSGTGVLPTLSLAGWWHTLVSLPMLLALFLGWLWRVLLWDRFLCLMARLNLRLIPGHPDLAGGLLFISTSLRAFWLLSFAFGTIVAGMVVNRIMHHGASLIHFKNVVIGLGVVVLCLFAGPLTIFMKKLRIAKQRGIFEYGALAGDVGRLFEKKWLHRAGGVDEDAMGAPDFSATADLYGVVANAYGMKDLPFNLKDLGFLVLAALLPFAPVALMAVPSKLILESLMKLLL
jgi:hypothetical protein